MEYGTFFTQVRVQIPQYNVIQIEVKSTVCCLPLSVIMSQGSGHIIIVLFFGLCILHIPVSTGKLH